MLHRIAPIAFAVGIALTCGAQGRAWAQTGEAHAPGEPGVVPSPPAVGETPGAHAERPGKHSTTTGRHGTQGDLGGGENTQSGVGAATDGRDDNRQKPVEQPR